MNVSLAAISRLCRVITTVLCTLQQHLTRILDLSISFVWSVPKIQWHVQRHSQLNEARTNKIIKIRSYDHDYIIMSLV